MYQVRFEGGALQRYTSLQEALSHDGGNWDKVSWSVDDSSRMILRKDGTWEYRTPESLRALITDP